MWFVCTVCLFTQKDVHFQIEINYTLSSSCTSNVVCVYSMSIYTKGRIIPKYKPTISSHHPARPMWFVCTVCLFTQKGVSFPNRNQLYPLIILHVQCGLCVHVCLFTQKGVSFPNRNQLYPLIILHVQCGLCVHVCQFTQKGVSFPNINQLYPLIILHVQCGLCVQYVYLHKRAYHSQI